jgi:hypothetical protein
MKDYRGIFLSKVRKETHCWIFTGYKNPAGYGVFYASNKRVFAHRYSHQLWIGPIPDGKMVLHSCDTPSCVNPRHLSIGTQADNMKDCSRRGRLANIRGGNNPNSKLSWSLVQSIRKQLGRSPTPEQVLASAESLGVTSSCIRAIIKRRTWYGLKSECIET